MSMNIRQAMSERRRILQNPYAYIEAIEELAAIQAARKLSENPYSFIDEIDRSSQPLGRFDGITLKESAIPNLPTPRRRTGDEIEKLVRQLHTQIWNERFSLFQDPNSLNPVDMLDPLVALGLIGYEVEEGNSIGQLSDAQGSMNIAGLIDKKNRKVFLAGAFSPVQRNFTAAHELGHALMHDFAAMHRDRPLDGSKKQTQPLEREADKFATCFLMPRKLVTTIFESIFGASPFELNEETRFALSGAVNAPNSWQPKDIRELSRLLGSATRFNGVNFVSLMTQFRVSREAMAIRLEELNLIRWQT